MTIMDNLSSIDWNNLKITSKVGWNGNMKNELDPTDWDIIFEACLKDIEKEINIDLIKNYFSVGKRGTIIISHQLKEIMNDVRQSAIDHLKKLNIDDDYRMNYWSISHRLMNKFRDEVLNVYSKDADYFSVQKLLNNLDISNYSIPYGQKRTLENNHDGKIIAYAINYFFKCGYFIVKTKRKYLGMMITSQFDSPKTFHSSIVPIRLKEAFDNIKEMRNIKSEINYDETLVKKEIEKEIQREVEAEL